MSENYDLVYHHAEKLRFIGILAYPIIIVLIPKMNQSVDFQGRNRENMILLLQYRKKGNFLIPKNDCAIDYTNIFFLANFSLIKNDHLLDLLVRKALILIYLRL